MKIVIDLPEEVTEWFKERAFIPIKYYTEVEKAMEKAEALSEIIDKISAEIKENMSWEMYDEYGNETALCKELMDIIEKYKGDKK